jgi:hypothetical protein
MIYRAIQAYQKTSGVHWDSLENKMEIGRGANVTTDAEGKVWQSTISLKVIFKKKLIRDPLPQTLIFFISEKSPFETFPQQGLVMVAIHGEDLTYSWCNWCMLVHTN